MFHNLNLDKNDPNYIMLDKIFKIIGSRKSKQIFSSNGFKNLKKLDTVIKTQFISMFFDLPLDFVVKNLKNKEELRKYFKINQVLEAQEIYDYFQRNSVENYADSVNSALKAFGNYKRRGKRTFIVDATPIDLDFNFNRKKQSKEKLRKMDLKWSYSSSKGFYIGFKATFVLDYDSMTPVAILFHSGAPNDAKLFEEIMKELHRRRIIRKQDTLIFDKGYYSLTNYQIGISKYQIVPLIFPKKFLNIKHLDDVLSYSLNIFKNKKQLNKNKRLFKRLKKELISKLMNWKHYKPIRGKIEDYFKVLKNSLEMRKIHKFTPKSVEKTLYLYVLLGTLLVQNSDTSKTGLQKLSQM